MAGTLALLEGLGPELAEALRCWQAWGSVALLATLTTLLITTHRQNTTRLLDAHKAGTLALLNWLGPGLAEGWSGTRWLGHRKDTRAMSGS